MSCGFSERVSAYAAGEPDDGLAAHLPTCAACRAELDEARGVLRSLGELAEPARAPERSDARGEPFWSDFSRDVRLAFDAEQARTRPGRRWSWLLAPTLAGAALAVTLLVPSWRGGHSLEPMAVVPVAPAAAGHAAPDVDDDDPLESELAASDHIEELDDAELDAVLAQLESAREDDPGDAPEADPIDALEQLGDDELDHALDVLVPGKGV